MSMNSNRFGQMIAYVDVAIIPSNARTATKKETRGENKLLRLLSSMELYLWASNKVKANVAPYNALYHKT